MLTPSILVLGIRTSVRQDKKSFRGDKLSSRRQFQFSQERMNMTVSQSIRR